MHDTENSNLHMGPVHNPFYSFKLAAPNPLLGYRNSPCQPTVLQFRDASLISAFAGTSIVNASKHIFFALIWEQIKFFFVASCTAAHKGESFLGPSRDASDNHVRLKYFKKL